MTLPITQVATTDLSDMLDPQGGRRMDLPGFDAEFVDFPDYIIRITDRIWHDRDVELCAKYYTEDCLIHTLTGQIIGADTVINNTYATMEAFPDRVLDADNVIWSDEGEAGKSLIGFHKTSHEVVMEQKLGHIDRPTSPEKNVREFAQAMLGNYLTPSGLDKLADVYDFRVSCLYPGKRDFYGHDEVGAFWGDLFAAMPDAEFRLEHVADIPYLGDAQDIAVRWSLAGHHSGGGLYGAPTGAPVYILGVSHWRVMNGRIREDVTVWDDVAVRRQIETVRQS